ncbi:MAG: Mov34/MPN/PAD-1 family protein [Clostridia bacterium]|nr:Mov34/MPN/PAD-1 family protein [Clostridia bacterium]
MRLQQFCSRLKNCGGGACKSLPLPLFSTKNITMYYIQQNILTEIIQTIGDSPIESGGIIGWRNHTICTYYFDKTNIQFEAEYTPNVEKLNQIIKHWAKDGVTFIGIVHSHPNGYNRPSISDEIYVRTLMEDNKSLTKLIFPILTKVNGNIKIDFYEFVEKFSPIKVICVE